VRVDLTPFDLPGPTRRKATCNRCGQVVRDNREITRDGAVYCRPCALGGYFTDAREIAWPEMNWAPSLNPEPPELPDSEVTGFHS
jgi:formylmethanofuran dehydrogenase subunit E